MNSASGRHSGINNWGLAPDSVQKIREVLAQYPRIERAVLYGSRAKGNYRPGSDIDLTLIGSAANWADLQQIELALDDLLLPYKFDLSLFSHIDNESLKEHIQRVGQLFYNKT